jgi:hypothetical protein
MDILHVTLNNQIRLHADKLEIPQEYNLNILEAYIHSFME